MPTIVYEPVSLGYACETKYQLARTLSSRLYPQRSEMAFRLSITQDDHGERQFLWRLFDWQSTPFDTLCRYLERDFEGFFEREDLTITQDGIVNARFGTVHVHEFPPARGRSQILDEDIDRGYPQARRRFERNCEDFRRLLTLPGPYLYVIADRRFPEVEALRRLIDLLSARSPDHQFHLLVIANEGEEADLSALDGRVTQGWRARDCGKPSMIQWEGHDPSWDVCLAPFALTLHEPPPDPVKTEFGASAGKAGAGPEPKRRFLGGLLGR
jgi:hypothetical protein